MALPTEIFNQASQQAQHARARDDAFLLAELRTRLTDRLPLLNRQLTNILLLTLDHAATKQAVQLLYAGAELMHITPACPMPALAAASFDAVIDCGYVSQHNNPPQLLQQFYAALQPGGVLLSCGYGGRSLQELRHALLQTDAEVFGGAAPRTNPMLDGTGLSTIISAAGFSSPLVDVDDLYVAYSTLNKLAADLRMAGMRAALIARAPSITKTAWRLAQKNYAQQFALPSGKLALTLEFLTAVAWRD